MSKLKDNKVIKREIEVNPFNEDSSMKESMFKVVPNKKERANGKSSTVL